MAEHIGSIVKWYVENNFKGTKIEFAEAIGLKQYTSLFRIFDAENITPKRLKKIAEVLKVDVVDLLKSNLNTPKVPVNQEVQLLRSEVKSLKEIVRILKEQIEMYKKHEMKSPKYSYKESDVPVGTFKKRKEVKNVVKKKA